MSGSRHGTPPLASSTTATDGDAQWLLTEGVPGGPAVGDQWRARRAEAIRAIAAGLRAIHAIPIDDFPAEWTGAGLGRAAAAVARRATAHRRRQSLVHGDACAPNTLDLDGRSRGPATSTSATSPSATAGPISRLPR